MDGRSEQTGMPASRVVCRGQRFQHQLVVQSCRLHKGQRQAQTGRAGLLHATMGSLRLILPGDLAFVPMMFAGLQGRDLRMV